MRTSLAFFLLVGGCAGSDRGDELLSGPGGVEAGEVESGEEGSDGPSAETTSDSTGAGGDPTGGAADGESGSSETGNAGDSGPPEGAPDCSQWWIGQYVPSTSYMTMKVPESAAEMFCHVNMERINYSFHTRNNGCVWDGTGDPQLSWPYEMQYDADLAASAQAEAEAVAAGGPPSGQAGSGGVNFLFYVDGCGSDVYTVTSVGDAFEDWPVGAALSKGNGSARMGIFYYDPGSGSPTLTKLGVGLAMTGTQRNWVLKFGS